MRKSRSFLWAVSLFSLKIIPSIILLISYQQSNVFLSSVQLPIKLFQHYFHLLSSVFSTLRHLSSFSFFPQIVISRQSVNNHEVTTQGTEVSWKSSKSTVSAFWLLSIWWLQKHPWAPLSFFFFPLITVFSFQKNLKFHTICPE